MAVKRYREELIWNNLYFKGNSNGLQSAIRLMTIFYDCEYDDDYESLLKFPCLRIDSETHKSVNSGDCVRVHYQQCRKSISFYKKCTYLAMKQYPIHFTPSD